MENHEVLFRDQDNSKTKERMPHTLTIKSPETKLPVVTSSLHRTSPSQSKDCSECSERLSRSKDVCCSGRRLPSPNTILRHAF